jgi:hypothetical protein
MICSVRPIFLRVPLYGELGAKDLSIHDRCCEPETFGGGSEGIGGAVPSAEGIRPLVNSTSRESFRRYVVSSSKRRIKVYYYRSATLYTC